MIVRTSWFDNSSIAFRRLLYDELYEEAQDFKNSNEVTLKIRASSYSSWEHKNHDSEAGYKYLKNYMATERDRPNYEEMEEMIAATGLTEEEILEIYHRDPMEDSNLVRQWLEP